MLVQDDKEIPICRIDRRGRVEIVALDALEVELLSKEKPHELYQVITDCVNNHIPAWYFPVLKKSRSRRVRLSVVSPGKKLKDEMIESYRERYDEDLELGRKLRAFEVDLIGLEDKEG